MPGTVLATGQEQGTKYTWFLFQPTTERHNTKANCQKNTENSFFGYRTPGLKKPCFFFFSPQSFDFIVFFSGEKEKEKSIMIKSLYCPSDQLVLRPYFYFSKEGSHRPMNERVQMKMSQQTPLTGYVLFCPKDLQNSTLF